MAQYTIHTPKQLFWDPQPDITVYELALCMPLFGEKSRLHQFHAQLPEEAKRHWRQPG